VPRTRKITEFAPNRANSQKSRTALYSRGDKVSDFAALRSIPAVTHAITPLTWKCSETKNERTARIIVSHTV